MVTPLCLSLTSKRSQQLHCGRDVCMLGIGCNSYSCAGLGGERGAAHL